MDIKESQSTPKEHRRTESIHIRVTPHITAWFTKNKVSPTKIFFAAIKELGYKQ